MRQLYLDALHAARNELDAVATKQRELEQLLPRVEKRCAALAKTVTGLQQLLDSFELPRED